MSQEQAESHLPEQVSWRVVDAWLAIPPCNYRDHPYCHMQCPYFYECYPNEFDDDVDCSSYEELDNQVLIV